MSSFSNKPGRHRRHYFAVPLLSICLSTSSLAFADLESATSKEQAPNTASTILIADASPKTAPKVDANGHDVQAPAPAGRRSASMATTPAMSPSTTGVNPSAASPMSAAGTSSAASAPSTQSSASARSLAPPALPALPAVPGAAQPPALQSTAAVPPGSRDSQPAMDALQSMNPSGWTNTPVRIYMPGIDPSINASSSISANPAVSAALQEEVQKAASNAPQFMPFDQLGTEVDAQRVAILREFRCVSVFIKTFKRGQRLIVARVYIFDSPECAYGAYSMLRQGASTVIRRGDGSSEDDQGISFWQGRTFVSIYGTSIDDDESKEVVRTIADKFSSVLKEHAGLPPILDQLPKLDRVKGSEHIVMGTLSARRFSPAPFLNYLDFSHASEAATSDYQIQSPPDRLRLLFVEYRFPGWASAAYRTYTQQFAGRAVAFEEPVIGETCMYKVNGTFILCQQIGSHLAIISGARKRQSASQLARFLH